MIRQGEASMLRSRSGMQLGDGKADTDGGDLISGGGSAPAPVRSRRLPEILPPPVMSASAFRRWQIAMIAETASALGSGWPELRNRPERTVALNAVAWWAR